MFTQLLAGTVPQVLPRLLPLLIVSGVMLLTVVAATHLSGGAGLDHIKSKTVGDGQHGTARWATPKEIRKTYQHISFRPKEWRMGTDRPKAQGLILPCTTQSEKWVASSRAIYRSILEQADSIVTG